MSAHTAWSESFFAAVDSMDARRFAEKFAEDGSFTFANHAPAVGRAAVAAQAQFVFDLITRIQHQQSHAWSEGNFQLNEGRAVYFRKDGKVIELPYFSVAEMEGGLVKKYRAYVDAAPLLAA